MIPETDYSALDRPEISMNSFYPRAGWTPTPPGAEDYFIPVEDGVQLSSRFFSAGPGQPTILFFYGNGETAPDYDRIAPFYVQTGVNFFVADYRGYGRSGGSPTFPSMIADCHLVLDALVEMLASEGYNGPVFVMGRSMGRHAAFELAAGRGSDLGGVIIESGRPNLGQFLYGLPREEARALEEGYLRKVASIHIPALVIHGEMDELAPLAQARAMFDSLASQQKRMLTIPNAGHNDLLFQGLPDYFGAIREFVFGG